MIALPELGAQINGPRMKPIRNKLNPSVTDSALTPKILGDISYAASVGTGDESNRKCYVAGDEA